MQANDAIDSRDRLLRAAAEAETVLVLGDAQGARRILRAAIDREVQVDAATWAERRAQEASVRRLTTTGWASPRRG